MATKFQLYTQLAQQQAEQLARSRGNWTAFLDTAARLYKYPFPEQLMIYAQRPDATACAPIETWNDPMHRWVRRGSKGIALLDDTGDWPRLKYVFDVSDTEPARENARKPFLWEMQQEHEGPVLEALGGTYDGVENDLGDALYNIASQLAQEYYNDNARDIGYCAEGSFLEDYDEFNLGVTFRHALTVSVAYSLMSRCGVNPDEYLADEDFQPVFDFNTEAAVYALGTAASDLSEQVLREIEVTIKRHERQRAAERSAEHERDHLHPAGGLPPAQPVPGGTANAGGQPARAGDVRQDAPEVSERPPGDLLQFPAADRAAVQPPAGDRPEGQRPDGADDAEPGAEEPAARQGDRPDGLDAAHEQPAQSGGGTHQERPDLQLNTEPEEAPPVQETPEPGGASASVEDAPAASGPEADPQPEQQAAPAEPPAPLAAALVGTPFTLEQADAILRDGGNQSRSALRIAAYYMKDKPLTDNAAFLAREYHRGGKGFQFGERQVSVWFDDTGMTLGSGKTARLDKQQVHLPWEQVAVRVRELLDDGNYLPRDVLDEAIDNEHGELAERLIFFYRDDLRDFREYPPQFQPEESSGFPDEKWCMKELLDDAEERGLIVERFEEDVEALLTDPNAPTMRRWHDPHQLLQDVRDSQITPRTFPARDTIQAPEYTRFITEDEVDAFFQRDGRYEDGKYSILSYYLQEHSAKERTDFIKERYHNGGGSHALGGADNSWYDGFGSKLKLTRGGLSQPYDEVALTWSAAAKRIEKLIQDGRYMTRAELDKAPEYEKRTLAQEITNFYSTLTVDIPRPYETRGDWIDGYDRNTVRAMLDDPAQVDVLLAAMRPIAEDTHADDRAYESRNTIVRRLTEYRDGTFTLFPGLDALPTPEQAIQRHAPRPRAYVPEQLTLFAEETPLPVLRGVEEQRAYVEQAVQEVEAARPPQPPEVTQADIDALLLGAVETPEQFDRILAQFAENPRSREALQSIKDIYSDGVYIMGRIDGAEGYMGLAADNSGVTVSKSGPLSLPEDQRGPTAAVDIPWAKVHRRVAELVEAGRFQEARDQPPTFYTSQQYLPYRVGDTVDARAADETTHVTMVIADIDANYVYYTMPSVPEQAPVEMFRSRFEGYLEDGRFQIVEPGRERGPQQEAPAEPEPPEDRQEPDAVQPEQVSAEPEAEYASPVRGIPYRVGSVVDARMEDGNHITMVVDKVEDDLIYYTTSEAERPIAGQGPIVTSRSRFEQCLDDGRYQVMEPGQERGEPEISADAEPPAVSPPEQGSRQPEPLPAPTRPGRMYDVGDTVYLEDDAAYIITGIGWRVNLELAPGQDTARLPSRESISRAGFEQVLALNDKNRHFTDYLAADPQNADADLQDVLENMMGDEGLDAVADLFVDGQTNSVVAHHLADSFRGEADSFIMEDGTETDYFGMDQGLQIEMQDKYGSKRGYSWNDVAVALRTITEDRQQSIISYHEQQRAAYYAENPQPLLYRAGDTVYLENERAYEVAEIGRYNIRLSDPTNVGGGARTMSLVDFERIVHEGSQNGHLLLPYHVGDTVYLEDETKYTVTSTDFGNIRVHPPDVDSPFPIMRQFSYGEFDLLVRENPRNAQPMEQEQAAPEPDALASEAPAPESLAEESPPPGSPEPVFFVNWDEAQGDFDLSLYADGDIVGYDKDGVQVAVGRSGSLTYVTTTGMFWGGNTVPGNIYEQINAYLDGKVTDVQVRENYLRILDAFREQREATAAEEPVAGAPQYRQGDTVYLDNDKEFVVKWIGFDEIDVWDTTKPSGISELIDRDEFERQYQANPRNFRPMEPQQQPEAPAAAAPGEDDFSDIDPAAIREHLENPTPEDEARLADMLGTAEDAYQRSQAELGEAPEPPSAAVSEQLARDIAELFDEDDGLSALDSVNEGFDLLATLNEQLRAGEIEPAVAMLQGIHLNSSTHDPVLEAQANGLIDRLHALRDGLSVPQASQQTEQDAIDAALREWNGDPASKRRVAEYMQAHGRERAAATYLQQEYGDGLPALPVVGARLDLPWPKAQRRIAQLMEQGAFLPPEELDAPEPERDAAPVQGQDAAEPSPQAPEPLPAAGDYRITDDSLGAGGPKTRFAANVAAIRTLKQIEDEGRAATAPEQEILARYVGWGGLSDAFDDTAESWQKEYAELKDLLTPEEYDKARASVLNSHYTPPVVIKAIYDAIGQMGFKRGNVLEPSCGIGNFFGLVPEGMRGAKLYGVELDDLSARIAGLLYPTATILNQGFEKTNFPDSFFDVAIGNVPFGDYKVHDNQYNKHNFYVHDYFIAKSIDKVRAGGIVALVTSNGVSGGTFDKRNSKARRYMAERCDLVGAIRLPDNTFKAAAGTDMNTDILFLQKREVPRDLATDTPDWVGVNVVHEHEHQLENGEISRTVLTLNNYYEQHPEMVLGILEVESGPYGPQLSCKPKDADLAEQLQEAVSHLRAELTEAEPALDDLMDSMDEAIPADPSVRNFSYTLVDDRVYYRENSLMYPVEQPATTLDRIRGLVELRDCVHALIDLQLEDYPDHAIREQQARLHQLYDNFTAEYGLINSTGNNRAFSTDSAYFLLCSLEILDEDGRLERKADMFDKRTIKQRQPVTAVDTASEALAVSIGEKARVDMDYMAELSGMSKEKLAEDLRGVIFRDLGDNPDSVAYAFVDLEKLPFVTADEYLSGNVRDKLSLANTLALKRPELAGAIAPNIEALEQAQPKNLEASEIGVRLGSTWVDKSYVQQFMYELLQTPYNMKNITKVKYTDYTGEWQVTGKARVPFNNVAATVTYGTSRRNAYEIIEDTLNLRDSRVYDTVTEDGKDKRVLNKKETTLAQQKQEIIKQAFKDWIWDEPQRRQTLVREYNILFNSSRPREYDGSHIIFNGMNPAFSMRPYQADAIARILYGGNTLLAHEVGAGKTFEMVAAAMEGKRLGLCSKSLFAVPNHIIDQIASDFLRLYPSANILVATKNDFQMRNRKKFCAKIATGDYDAIIMGHSQLEKIPISKERQERLLQEQLWEVLEGIAELKSSRGERFSIKQLERTKKRLETRLEKLREGKGKDDVVTFEQLGVDRLFVDEAHNYKNLFLYTKMRNVAGLSSAEAQKSSDLFLKCRYMDELTEGKGVIFATGTPVSNSMTELYTMQRYLQYDNLERKNLVHFDSWASIFGETVTAMELAPEGTGYRARTRFSRFHNLPELMGMFKETADIKTADTLDLERPEAHFETIVVQPSELQQEMVADLSERAALVHAGQVDPSEDNMLKITSDGRKIGLDQRLINPMLPDFEGSKVNACMEKVHKIWDDTKSDRLTQLVFCDFSTPNKDGRFNVYDDIRDKLIAKGIPEHEIAFIHDANTDPKKKELFAKVRKGQVRVLFGSTFKMGAGTNVQDKLIAIHDLDCPWRPADLEQRAGRIVRFGNSNPEVFIYRYATEGTFDAYLWQTVENKQKFISQIMTSKSPVRSCEDVDETALSYAEIKALCSGNPLIKEKIDLDIEVARLRLLKSEHQSQHHRLEDDLLKYYPESIQSAQEKIAGLEKDIATYNANLPPMPEPAPAAEGEEAAEPVAPFPPMTVLGTTHTDKETAGKALIDACKTVATTTDPVQVGSYMGFDMSIRFDSFNKKYTLSLKGDMSRTVDLGTDTFGNITRINNALRELPKNLESWRSSLENLQKQMEDAKLELLRPFEQQEELAEKEMRLALVNAELNIEDGPKPLEAAAGMGAVEHSAKTAKPSILENLRTQAADRPANRPVKSAAVDVSR